MERRPSTFPRAPAARLATVALALASAAAVLAATAPFGPAIDGDGVLTLSAAENLRRGRGLVTFAGDPYTSWPPLYPATIAALESLGLGRTDALRWINAASACATIALGAHLVRAAAGSARLGALHALLVATSVALYWQFFQAGSEALFVALSLGALACAVRHAATRGRAALAGAVALAAAACLQRYVGIAVSATLAAVLVSDRDGRRGATRWARAAIAAAASALPLAAWLLRNRSLEERWTGPRGEPRASAGEALADLSRGVTAWLFPAQPDVGAGFAAACAIGLGAACAAALRARSYGPGEPRAAGVALATFTALYSTLLVTASATIEIDRISQRLLVPALPFALALALLGLDGFAQRASRSHARARAAAPWLVAIGVGLVAARGAREVRTAILEGRADGVGGFCTRFWDEHALVRHVRAQRPLPPIHSNLPELVYLETGAPASMLWPSRAQHRRVGARAGAEARAQTVVWFQHQGKPRLFLDEIERSARVERRFESAVGAVVVAWPR